jgi:murein L,D-transpeptidase YcbB/YkuD
MKYYSTLVLFIFIFSHVSLISNAADPDADNTIQLSIREHVDKLEKLKTIKLNGEKVIGNTEIISIYKENDYKPLWKNANNRNDLVEILESAYFDGLNPEDYHIEYIKSYVRDIAEGNELKLKDEAASDLIMTNALLTYAYHMIQGKVNPSELDPNWNYSKKVLPDSVNFRVIHSLQNQLLKEGAKNIRPDIKMYTKFRDLFAQYDSINKVNEDIEQIEYPGKALRLGDSSPVVGELKKHLSHFDNTMNSSDDNVFDEDLQAALIKFQEFNKLDADGIAGKKTFEMLNLSIADRLDILRVNMERCRWLNNDLPEDFLLVNIADYNLFILRNKKVDYQCRVVVGKEYHKTPVFASEIKYIVFNPTWTVPYSIATKETLPKLKADPQYLQKHNMTLLKGSKVVDPASVDFNNYSRKNFPFTIRQEPGSNNALGQVKFIFPNKHSVYLHDTPSKSYFQKTERAFSHGCVRVHNPLVLAEKILKNQGYYK